MTLKELKELYKNVDDSQVFEYGISEPMSWRGSYDEVCFSVDYNVTGKEIKDRIEKAYTETFYGHKGGEFEFYDDTYVNFECSSSSWSDGGYVQDMIDQLESYPDDNETKLVKLMLGK